MDELLPDALARLSATVETLERRVYALEHPTTKQQAPSQLEEIDSLAAIPRPLPSAQSGWSLLSSREVHASELPERIYCGR